MEGEEVIKRGRGVGRFERGFLFHQAGSLNKTNTLWVSGGSGAFRKRVWDELGGLDSLFNPFYWEDIDLSYRALKAGYKLVFEGSSVVRHEHGKGAIKKQYSSGSVKRISYRNQILFVWLNITDLNLVTSHLFWLPYHLMHTLFQGDFNFLLGLISALGRIPAILVKRNQRKRIFVLSDREVLLPFKENSND